ncbi:hypothetical protein ACI77O_12360 [Pseudomonas tritici]|uniref:hypothetical protein n=1 Tax=Pseudomonas tritici TaxID=2745518 RepID=UPI00387B451F
MTKFITNYQLDEAALQTVLGTLAYSRSFMESLMAIQLPVMNHSGVVHGHAMDNAAVFEQYPADWTGLAIKNSNGRNEYWFLYRSEVFGHERAMTCLGEQFSVCTAILAAYHAVRLDLLCWRGAKAA